MELLFDTQTTSGRRRLSGSACFESRTKSYTREGNLSVKKRITKGPNTFIERELNAVKLHRCIASMWQGDYNDRARV